MSERDLLSEVSALAAARTVVSDSQRLGLTWQLKLGTVADSTLSTARLDGDTVAIRVINMTGQQLTVGRRVYVIVLPPAGNYVVGLVDDTQLGNETYNNVDTGDPSSGNTTSAAFASMPGPMSFTVTKLFEATRLKLFMSGTWFDALGTAGTSAAFGLNIAGASSGNGDYAMSAYLATLPPGVVRLPTIAAERAVAVGSGLLTITAIWRRVGGVGQPTVAGDQDFLSMSAEEVW